MKYILRQCNVSTRKKDECPVPCFDYEERVDILINFYGGGKNGFGRN